jgi:hypothetical protein
VRRISWFPYRNYRHSAIQPAATRSVIEIANIGRQFLAGFRDFILNATIHEFHEHDHQIDVVGDTAVVTFAYEMRYERSGERYRATGRDFWVFQRQGIAWVAVWRTMLDLNESAA